MSLLVSVTRLPTPGCPLRHWFRNAAIPLSDVLRREITPKRTDAVASGSFEKAPIKRGRVSQTGCSRLRRVFGLTF